MSPRKLNIAQAILKVDDQQLIDELESFLKSKNIQIKTQNHSRKTIDEFENELDKSINDLELGNYKNASELLEEIKSW